MLDGLDLLDLELPREDISVERAHGRNDNTIVRCKGRGSYFVKRAYAADSSARHLLSYEASFCRFCNERDETRRLRGLVPQLVAYDPEGSAFAYELLEEASPLWSAYNDASAGATTVAVALELGKRLAQLHLRCSEVASAEARDWIASRIPGAFTIHRPAPADLSVLSTGAHKLVSIVQQRWNMCEAVDALRQEWKNISILHGDIRSENALVCYEDGSKKRPIVNFVDFETAQFGDPAWDVAGALQDAVLFWLYSMTPNADVNLMIASATHSLSEIQTIVRAFLLGYSSEYRLDPGDSGRFIERAIRFSAVRMLQSAYESAADAHDLPAPAVLLLQLAENVLNDPRGAMRGFYGLAFD